MSERVCLVTGANSGIGLETARALAALGWTVVMAARDPVKGAAAVEDVKGSSPNGRVELLQLDLASWASIRQAAETFLSRHDHLNVLVNNAGLVVTSEDRTEEGFPVQFGVNHLGHFLLTWLLMDALKAGAPSRIVNVASEAHRTSKGLDFDALARKDMSTGFTGYGDSKLANILYTRELARRLEGTGVTANSLHPGVVGTRFGADGDTGWFMTAILWLGRPLLKTPAKGAATSIYLATAPHLDDVSGRYFKDCAEARPTKYAEDDDAARRLWTLSEELLGIS